jgi:hypothetical protein
VRVISKATEPLRILKRLRAVVICYSESQATAA